MRKNAAVWIAAFPVHPDDALKPGAPRSIPWHMVKPHEKQAIANHSQTLERLEQRGGLTMSELIAVLEDREWAPIDDGAAIAKLAELESAYETKARSR